MSIYNIYFDSRALHCIHGTVFAYISIFMEIFLKILIKLIFQEYRIQKRDCFNSKNKKYFFSKSDNLILFKVIKNMHIFIYVYKIENKQLP